ncbi:hypothetical protein BD408DRAFT_44469 [Parasitella parasitica]|nr:hypothetical protein BD408DRAFT_44469 [Parasitella parasitica]
MHQTTSPEYTEIPMPMANNTNENSPNHDSSSQKPTPKANRRCYHKLNKWHCLLIVLATIFCITGIVVYFPGSKMDTARTIFNYVAMGILSVILIIIMVLAGPNACLCLAAANF